MLRLANAVDFRDRATVEGLGHDVVKGIRGALDDFRSERAG